MGHFPALTPLGKRSQFLTNSCGIDQMDLHPKDEFKRDSKGRIKLRWEALAFSRGISQLFSAESMPTVFLNECHVIGRDGLLWLLSIAQFRASRRLAPLSVYLPDSQRHATYLSSVQFPQQFLAAGGVIGNEYVLAAYPPQDLSDRSDRHSLRFLQYIDDASVDSIVTSLSSSTIAKQLNRRVADEIYFQIPLYQLLMRELIINVNLHAGDAYNGGVGYASYEPFPTGYPIIRFGCSDIGPGFQTTLASKAQLPRPDEATALKHALLFRYFHSQKRVVGYYSAIHFLYQLYGLLYIRTQDVCLTLDMTERSTAVEAFRNGYSSPTETWIDSITHIRSNLARVPGVHVLLDLHRERSRPSLVGPMSTSRENS